MAKSSGERWFVKHDATDRLLVSFEHGLRWRFHAFIGDSWPSEALAMQKVEELVKTQAIPASKYSATKR